MVVEIPAFRIAYMPLPKAGSTTIKHALAQIDPAMNRAGARTYGTDVYHTYYQTRRYRADHWRRYDRGWHRFCVVRDPFERLISFYTNRVVGSKDLYKSRQLKRRQIDLPKDPDPDFFFCNIDTYARYASAVRHHTLPVNMFLGIREATYDDVFRLEELDACISFLESRSKKRLERRALNTSQTCLTLDDLNGTTKAHLSRYLGQEYRDLARWYDNPFG